MSYWDTMIGELGAIPVLPGARCVGSHEIYDAASTVDTYGHDHLDYARDAALQLCSRCPALHACAAWLDSLPATKQPVGVIAGRINQPKAPPPGGNHP